VVNVSNRTLMQVDPEGSQVFGTASAPTGVAFADDRVWVTYGFSSDPSRGMDVLDPVDHVVGPAQISLPNGSYAIAAGADVLWIGDPLGSTVMRYDPASGQTTTVELPGGSGVTSIGVGDESVWVTAGREPSVFRIDVADPTQPVERFGTGGDLPTALSVAPDGTVWMVRRDADSVLSLSSSGSTNVDVALGDQCDAPNAVAATDDAVWVSCATSSNVVKLNPADGSVVTSLATDGDPGPLAADDDGSVWVAVRGDA
jgi:streptogramin lyase